MRRTAFWRHSAFAVLSTAVASLSALAQSNAGAMAGTVVDSSGGGVPAVTVTATNIATGVTQKTSTGATGAYNFPTLAVGGYNVTAAAPNFKTAQSTGVIVQIQTTTALDITLALGSANETVNVQADAPQLQTQSADVGTVVTPKQVLDLPLSTNGSAIRNSQSFVFLTPATYGTGTSGGTFEGAVSGGQAFGSEIIFDGASLQVASFGDGFADEILPSVESTGEFKVLISGVPAQYGRTTGGIQSYASKSGGNDFHGGVFELFRNTALDANTWFNNLQIGQQGRSRAIDTPPDKKNEFGLLLGGPVWIPKIYNGRDRTFFFFHWGQFRQNQGYSNLITIPTQANLAGDFSANLTNTQVGVNPCDGSPIFQGQIFDPSTTRTVNGTPCRTAYPGNRITTPLSAAAQNIVKFIPAPTLPGLVNNYNFTGSYPIISTTETIRIDHSFGANDKIFGSYNVRENVRNNNIGGLLQLPVSNFLTFQDLPTHLVRIGYDHIFSPSLLNHLLIGFTRVLNDEGYVTSTGSTNYSQQLGVPGGSGPLFTGVIPTGINQNESSTVSFGNPQFNAGYNSSISDNSYYLGDAVSLTRGRHNLTMGGEYRYILSISSYLSPLNGNFYFSRNQTAATLESAASNGNGVASFLLGQVAQVSATRDLVTTRNVGHYGALYIQDEFKYNKDLNLSLGLRYNVDVPFREAHDFGAQFSPTAINTGVNGTGTGGALTFAGNGPGRDGISSRYANVYYKSVEPRVGITWAPSALDHKSVFSATYSILTAPILEWQQIYNGIPAGYSSTGQVNNTGSPFYAAGLLDGSSPVTPGLLSSTVGVPATATTVNYDRSQLNGNSIPWNQRGFGRPGFAQTWSATVQQQVANDLIFTLGYLGERGTHLGSNLLYVNNINPRYFSLGAHLNDPAGTNGVVPPYPGFTQSVAQALRPFPQYSTINTAAYGENQGQLTYHALTAKLERRFHNGLNLLASYTWSKSLTDTGNIIGGSLGGSYTASIQNPFNLKAEKAISPQDVPHIFVVSYLYELPFGKGKTFLNRGGLLNRVVGGWSISGIQRYQSGQPLGFGCATGIPSFNNCIRFNLVPGQELQSSARRGGSFNPAIAGRNVWYNAAGVSDPNSNVTVASGLPYSFGNKPQYQSNDRALPYYSEDFGLIKRTAITERVGLQFRAEFFNAFNRHVFGNPNNNPFDSGFGTVGYQSNSPRNGQLTLRVEF